MNKRINQHKQPWTHTHTHTITSPSPFPLHIRPSPPSPLPHSVLPVPFLVSFPRHTTPPVPPSRAVVPFPATPPAPPCTPVLFIPCLLLLLPAPFPVPPYTHPTCSLCSLITRHSPSRLLHELSSVVINHGSFRPKRKKRGLIKKGSN